MKQVPTVNGPVDADHLGATLMHEHLFVKNPELESNFPNPEWDEERVLATSRENLAELYQKGISTIVDLTVMGLGRDVQRIKKLAQGLELNVVVATGYYTFADLPMYFHNHGPGRLIDVPEPLDKMFVSDITEGISGTDVKAAVIKVVTEEPGITPDLERVLTSAARAHFETGALITTHSNAKLETGRLQQQFFKRQGVDLGRVLIGHCGDTTDLDYLRELLDNGSPIGLDRFGANNRLPENERIETAMKLIDLGYTDRLTFSHDAACWSINSEPSYRLVSSPQWHHANISERILPEMKRRGVSEETLQQIMVENPARLLPFSD